LEHPKERDRQPAGRGAPAPAFGKEGCVDMTLKGQVTALCDGLADVEHLRYSACGKSCGRCGGCESRPSSLTAANPVNAKVGDTVEVAMPEESVLTLALAVYALPLALMAVFGLAAHALFRHTAAAVIGALTGACLWIFILTRINARVALSGKYRGEITAILNRAESEDSNVET